MFLSLPLSAKIGSLFLATARPTPKLNYLQLASLTLLSLTLKAISSLTALFYPKTLPTFAFPLSTPRVAVPSRFVFLPRHLKIITPTLAPSSFPPLLALIQTSLLPTPPLLLPANPFPTLKLTSISTNQTAKPLFSPSKTL